MRSGVASTRVTVETQVGADILTEASIVFDDIAEDVVPDATDTRDIGSSTKYWLCVYTTRLFATNLAKTLLMYFDDTYDIGSSTKKLRTIYVNDIQGDARALIMMGI